VCGASHKTSKQKEGKMAARYVNLIQKKKEADEGGTRRGSIQLEP